MLQSADDNRLRVLRSTQLLDSAPEGAFDRLTRLASGLLNAPVALVSLVDEHRQFFKSALGLKEPWASRRETPLTHSFCQYVTRDRAPLVVDDARAHPVLRDNLAIRDLGVIAYAGMPLIIAGEAIGVLCVVDDEPRSWSRRELALLEDLAASVVSEIALRLTSRVEHDQRALLGALIESLGDAVLAIDRSRTFVIVNAAARQIFSQGVEVGRSVRDDWAALHRSRRPDGSTLPPEEGALGRGLRGEETDGLTFTLQRPSEEKEPVWVEVRGRPVRGVEGDVIAAVAVYRDVTETKHRLDNLSQARDLLAREHTIHEATVANIADGVLLLDADSRVLLANEAFAAMFSLSHARVKGMTRKQFMKHAGEVLADPADVVRFESSPEPVEEFVFARPRRRVLRRNWSRLELAGDGSALLVTWHDVTAERDLIVEREQQLLIDALTGIPNRRGAEVALGIEEARMKRAGTPLCVALLDIDHFKAVNDAFGHPAGDEVLRQVAATLAAQARVTDTVARWGGEEFLAILPNVGLEGAQAFCERARLAVESIQLPKVGMISISAGVTAVEVDETCAAAIARADERLYEAKRGGRNSVRA